MKLLNDRWRILGTLGSGQYGKVYHVRDDEQSLEAAAKRLHGYLGNRSIISAQELFERETSALLRLDHEAIAKYHDGFWISDDLNPDDTHPVIVSEFVPGPTTEELIRNGKPLKEEEAVSFAQRIGGALAYASDRGLVHRDLGPWNLKGESPAVKILDWGRSRELSERLKTEMVASVAPGFEDRLHYYAPETAFGGTEPSTDLFSLAMVTKNLLLGRSAPAVVDDSLGFVNPRLRELLAKNLSGDPGMRSENPRAFLEELAAMNGAHSRAVVPEVPVRDAAASHSHTEGPVTREYESGTVPVMLPQEEMSLEERLLECGTPSGATFATQADKGFSRDHYRLRVLRDAAENSPLLRRVLEGETTLPDEIEAYENLRDGERLWALDEVMPGAARAYRGFFTGPCSSYGTVVAGGGVLASWLGAIQVGMLLPDPASMLTAVVGGIASVPLAEYADIGREKKRLKKRAERLQSNIEQTLDRHERDIPQPRSRYAPEAPRLTFTEREPLAYHLRQAKWEMDGVEEALATEIPEERAARYRKVFDDAFEGGVSRAFVAYLLNYSADELEERYEDHLRKGTNSFVSGVGYLGGYTVKDWFDIYEATGRRAIDLGASDLGIKRGKSALPAGLWTASGSSVGAGLLFSPAFLVGGAVAGLGAAVITALESAPHRGSSPDIRTVQEAARTCGLQGLEQELHDAFYGGDRSVSANQEWKQYLTLAGLPDPGLSGSPV